MPTGTDPDTPAPAPPLADLSTVLTVAAGAAGFDLDLDEIVVCAGMEPELTLALIQAAGLHAINRYARTLLTDAEEFMRTSTLDIDGETAWPQLDDITAAATLLDAQEALLTVAVARACQALADTHLGLAWTATGTDPQPPPPAG